MSQEYRATRRPKRTQDLLRRLESVDTTEKEKEALHDLCRCMVEIFSNDPKRVYISEAAALAPALRYVNKEKLLADLLTALGNAIIKGTADGSIEQAGLYKAFAYVLWHTRDIPAIRSVLSSVLRSLLTRLKQATINADLHTQYVIVCSMSAILDSMVDIRLSGISREGFHEPLLKQLRDLAKHEDLRLAQASSYAYQAALGIKDDEGPLEALWRYVTKAVQNGADIAGAVSGMDAGALLKSLPSVSSIVDLVRKLIDIGENVAEIMKDTNDVKEWIDSTYKISRQKGWYKALRYVEVLLQSEAWLALEYFIEHVPCYKEAQFQCGLYCEIEKVWRMADLTGNDSKKDKLISVYHKLSSSLISTELVVQAWKGIVSTTLGVAIVDSVKISRRGWLGKSKSFSTVLEMFPRWLDLDTNDNTLLQDAWLATGSLTSKIFYMDLAIREHYRLSKKLHIERLSGQLLPMDKCYINLSIQDKSEESNMQQEKAPFSLKARLRLEADQRNGGIQLQDLFIERQLAGRTFEPRRIFIQGRAGIGKTTLCKKIVYDFLAGVNWAGKFDRLLWLPLRKLQIADEKRAWRQLLADESSQLGSDAETLVEVFASQFEEDQTFRKRTLLLLDGLDEVALRWPNGSPTHCFLRKLLMMPSVIVTSRPQIKAIDMDSFDLELETVGFLPDQVQTYLEHCIEDQHTIAKINEFLGLRPLVQGLVRIPIQLDAFCYTWHTESCNLTAESNTMTALYQSICAELGKKDIIRLEKMKEIHSNNINLLGSFEVKDILHQEQQYLEEFAFQGLYNNVINFSPQHQEIIGEHLHRKLVRLDGPFKIVLEKLSFLRSSGSNEGIQHQYVHFLHLTFQEFFAARFFVHHWKNGSLITCLKLDKMVDAKTLMPEVFVGNEKYNPRYHMFWRFVTGLLQSQTSSDRSNGLQTFLDTLELPPRDYLGFSHHRLLMYVSSEISYASNRSVMILQKGINRQLYNWAYFESAAFRNHWSRISRDEIKRTRLVAEQEFPELVLGELLIGTNLQVRIMALEALFSKNRTPGPLTWKRFIDLFTEPFQDGRISYDALETLRFAGQMASEDIFPEELVQVLLHFLSHSDRRISCGAINALAWIYNLPVEAPDILLSIIKHSPNLAIESATNIGIFLCNLPPLSQNNLAELLDLMNHPDGNRSRFATNVVLSLCGSQGHNIVSIYNKIGDTVKRAIIKELDGHCNSDSAEAVWMALLQDVSSSIRLEALQNLRYYIQRTDSSKVAQLLLSMMNVGDYETQFQATVAMATAMLLENAQRCLVLFLKQADTYIQEVACTAIRTRGWFHRSNALADDIVDLLIGMMEERNNVTRALAMGFLPLSRFATPYPQQFSASQLTRLLDLLDRGDHQWRKSISSCLRAQKTLPPVLWDSIMTKISVADDNSFEEYTNILHTDRCLPTEVILTIEQWLRSSSSSLRTAAATVCAFATRLPDTILSQLIGLLVYEHNCTHSELNTKPVDTSGSKVYTDLTFDCSTTGRCHDVRTPAIMSFYYERIPEEIVDICIQWIYDEDLYVRNASTNLLAKQIYKSPKVWLALVHHNQSHQRLEDENENAWKRIMLLSRHVEVSSLGDSFREVELTASKLLAGTQRSTQLMGAWLLQQIPDLKWTTIQILTDIWSQKLENLQDIHWESSILGLNKWYIKLLKRQANLPQSTINILLLLFRRECREKNPFNEKDAELTFSERKQLLRDIAQLLVRQFSRGNLESYVMVDLIQTSILKVRENILLELIIQNTEHKLVSSLNNEALEILCLIYLSRASEVEICCYDSPKGLCVRRDNREMNLNLNSEQRNDIIQMLRKVKLQYGFVEPSDTRSLDSFSDSFNS